MPVWHSVTVAFSLRRVSSRPSGRPTVTPRPTTHTSAPAIAHVVAAQQLDDAVRRAGQRRRARPSTSQPRFVGCSPSASLAGSIRLEHAVVVHVPGQRQLDDVAGAGRVGVQLGDRAPRPRPGSRSRAGPRRIEAMPTSAQSRCLPRDVPPEPGSSPTSTVPSPGTTPCSRSAATRSVELGLDGWPRSPCRPGSVRSRGHPCTRGHRRGASGGLRAAQWKKCRVPVRYIVTPAASAAATTSSSRTEPPGCTTARTPASSRICGPSANGKKASDAATDPAARSPARATASRRSRPG